MIVVKLFNIFLSFYIINDRFAFFEAHREYLVYQPNGHTGHQVIFVQLEIKVI